MKKGSVLLSMEGFEPGPWKKRLSIEREVRLAPHGDVDPEIAYAVVWKPATGLLNRLPNLRAIFSVGAGVDSLMTLSDLPDVPIVRVVARNLSQHMSEYVLWRVLDHHRQGILLRNQQSRAIWQEPPQSTASEISIGIMGLGELGRSAALALKAVGFQVKGWSKTSKLIDGVVSYHGDGGLKPFLNGSDILVVLLPLTSATRGIVNYSLLRELRRDNKLGGAILINAGRGLLQNELDILRALDDGTLKEASLDVFATEPLPAKSLFWLHPKIFVTPHSAAASDPEYLVGPMLNQMEQLERGEPLRDVVDRRKGY